MGVAELLAEERERQGLVLCRKKDIEAVRQRKEKLRLALNEAGFSIPPGKTLEEWIPYIEKKPLRNGFRLLRRRL